jgi:hypothetical protein
MNVFLANFGVKHNDLMIYLSKLIYSNQQSFESPRSRSFYLETRRRIEGLFGLYK